MVAEAEDPDLALDFPDFLVSEDLVPSNPQIPSQTTTIDFGGLLNPPLVLQTNEAECGGKLWPGGMVLANYLLRTRTAELAGKTITELGAGSGLVSLAVALGLRTHNTSTEIHITDGLETLIPLLHQNVSLNKANISDITLVKPTRLAWGEKIPDAIPRCINVLLAADCCYFEPSFPLLVKSMEDLIGKSTVCYFCFKKRRRADMDVIRRLTKSFEVEKIEDEFGWERDGVFLYRIRRRSSED